MTSAARRETFVMLDAETLDAAEALGLDVSAVADEALLRAVIGAQLRADREAERLQWLEENAEVFKAQREWLEKNGHPAADLMIGPAAAFWKK